MNLFLFLFLFLSLNTSTVSKVKRKCLFASFPDVWQLSSCMYEESGYASNGTLLPARAEREFLFRPSGTFLLSCHNKDPSNNNGSTRRHITRHRTQCHQRKYAHIFSLSLSHTRALLVHSTFHTVSISMRVEK